jgi:hypothetical protein
MDLSFEELWKLIEDSALEIAKEVDIPLVMPPLAPEVLQRLQMLWPALKTEMERHNR